MMTMLLIGAELLSRAAGQQDSTALYELGLLQLAGRGMPQNTEQGIKTIESAAQLNNPNALFHMAVRLFSGDGVEKDTTRAADFIARAASLGSLEAMYAFGMRLLRGWDVPHDPQQVCCFASLIRPLNVMKGLKWLEAAAAHNHVHAMLALAGAFREGVGEAVKPSIQDAFKWLERAAETGDADAMFELAREQLLMVNGKVQVGPRKGCGDDGPAAASAPPKVDAESAKVLAKSAAAWCERAANHVCLLCRLFCLLNG